MVDVKIGEFFGRFSDVGEKHVIAFFDHKNLTEYKLKDRRSSNSHKDRQTDVHPPHKHTDTHMFFHFSAFHFFR